MSVMYADTVILNGSVLTVNQQDDVTEAVAIRDGKILAVGSNSEIEAYIGDETNVIQAGGKTVMPGFVDAHIHFGMYGLLDHGIIDINYPKAKSIEEIKALIRAKRRRASGSNSKAMITTNSWKSATPPRRILTRRHRRIQSNAPAAVHIWRFTTLWLWR